MMRESYKQDKHVLDLFWFWLHFMLLQFWLTFCSKVIMVLFHKSHRMLKCSIAPEEQQWEPRENPVKWQKQMCWKGRHGAGLLQPQFRIIRVLANRTHSRTTDSPAVTASLIYRHLMGSAASTDSECSDGSLEISDKGLTFSTPQSFPSVSFHWTLNLSNS